MNRVDYLLNEIRWVADRLFYKNDPAKRSQDAEKMADLFRELDREIQRGQLPQEWKK